jgi:hypothetical protein
MGAKLTTDVFIEKAKRVHGSDTYDYTLTDYKYSNEHITIICKIHGEFKQKPHYHLSGNGCSLCGVIKFKYKKTISDEYALKRLIDVHGDTYDYSLFIYKGIDHKIDIICKKHGVFSAIYRNHYYSKTGCYHCQFNTKEEYITKLNLIHNNIYDYSLVEYIKLSDKVKIICKIHGVFCQRLSAHLDGQKCPSCISTSSYEENKWLDSLNIQTLLRQYKIMPRFIVDGYDPSTNTIYQYHGIYWHGHPSYFDQNKLHPHYKTKTFGDLYKRTLETDNKIIKMGYNLVIRWSHEK